MSREDAKALRKAILDFELLKQKKNVDIKSDNYLNSKFIIQHSKLTERQGGFILDSSQITLVNAPLRGTHISADLKTVINESRTVERR